MVVITPFLLILITVITSIVGVSVATYIIVTQDKPDVPPVVIVCSNGTHIVNGSCVLDVPVPPVVNDTIPDNDTVPPVVVPPVVTPPAKELKVIVVGDIADTTSGNKVYQAIKAQNADYVFVLGDLGYENDLSWFKSTYGTSDKVYCVVGNHEAANEDGSASLQKETLEFCGNTYWIKNGATLFVMINTNDPNLNVLADRIGKTFQNSTTMSGVKTVHIMSHKPCSVPPNSHHPVEIKPFCDAIKSKIPSGLQVFYTQAHNHIMSESADKVYKQIGAGGKSHYTCGTNTEFPFCNDSSYGYLQYVIQPNGTTASSFIDFNGVVKH